MTKFLPILKLTLVMMLPWLTNNNAVASTSIDKNQELRLEEEQIADTTNVYQLQDVSLSDWAYEALRHLVEKYNCIAGYPNGTFGKQRILSRYEFAAGLNACTMKIENLQQEKIPILQQDLTTLQRLQDDFSSELKAIANNIDNLENQVAFIEDNSFSTTTKLRGEVLIAVVASGGSDRNIEDEDESAGNQFSLGNRVRLNLQTSFTGKDSLIIRLQSGNMPELDESFGTEMARLGFDANSNNNLAVRDLQYRFPLNDNIRVWLGANSFSFRTIANLHNPILESSGKGAISRFTRRNPAVFRNGSEQQGIGTNIEFNEIVSLDLGYFAGSGEDPSTGNGIFNGDYTAIGQLNFEPTENLDFGLAFGYSHAQNSVNLSGTVGSPLAKRPFGRVPTSALRAGIQGSWRISKKLNLAGWAGYVQGRNESKGNQDQRADIWNWSANLAFLDVVKEGDFLAFAGGMPPKVTSIDRSIADKDTSYIIELVYSYPLTDNIKITPGAYVIINPDHNSNNDTIWVSVIRTTLRF